MKQKLLFVLMLFVFSGSFLLPQAAAITTSERYFKLKDRMVRLLDDRLSGAVLSILGDPNNPPRKEWYPDTHGLIYAGCDIGAWRFKFDNHIDSEQPNLTKDTPTEMTLNLQFSDKTFRTKYNLKGILVKKDYRTGENEFAWTKGEKVKVVEDLKNVLSFSGRNLRQFGNDLFYLTSFGAFHSPNSGGIWYSCATFKPDLVTGDKPGAFNPGGVVPPMGVNDIGYIREYTITDKESNKTYFLAADDGLYILEIKIIVSKLPEPPTCTYAWTKLPLLAGLPFYRLLCPPVSADSPKNLHTFFCLTDNSIYVLDLFGTDEVPIENWHADEVQVVSQDNPPVMVDLRKEIGRFLNASNNTDGKFALVIGDHGIVLLEFQLRKDTHNKYEVTKKGCFDEKLLSPKLKGIDHLYFRQLYFSSGQKAAFLDDDTIVICNVDSILRLTPDLKDTIDIIKLDIGSGDYEDQLISCVSAPWAGFIAIGSTEGGVIVLRNDWLQPEGKKLPNNGLEPVCVWSRGEPEATTEKIIPGIPRLCSHGEYVSDNNPPCGNDTKEQEIKAIIDMVVGVVLQNPKQIAEGFFRLLVAWGRSDVQIFRDIANIFYGYRGKAACYMIPSAPIPIDATVKEIIPRVIEGVHIDDPKYHYQFATADFINDAPCGWARFEKDTEKPIVVNGQKTGVIYFSLFKNWSHDRDRTARLDVIVKLDLRKGRKIEEK